MKRIYTLFLRVQIPAILCSLVLTTCGQNAEVDSVCMQSARWNSASTQLAILLPNLESLPKSQIRETMTGVIATLIALNDVAPREIKSDVELLLSTYGSLSDALQALNWDGSASQQDSEVTSVAVRLSSEEIQRSQTNLTNFIRDECLVKIDNAVNQFPNVGTTLPEPAIQEEDALEPPATFDNDETLPRAFGYVVVERFGVAITDKQANCVGVALLDAVSIDATVVDTTYWQMLQAIFDSCGLKIDVIKMLENE